MSAETLNKVRDQKRCKRAKEKSPLAFPPKLSLSLALDSIFIDHYPFLPVFVVTFLQ
jgi:hypothetical protein